MGKKLLRFSADIFKFGINPVVDVPDDVLNGLFGQAARSKGPIPVCGKLKGAEFIQTLVKYRGAWRLYVNGPILKAAKLKVGDIADVEIEFDPRPRDVPVPKMLADALKSNKNADNEFRKLPPSRRKEILRYLASLKNEDALVRNVERVIRQLNGEPVKNIRTTFGQHQK